MTPDPAEIIEVAIVEDDPGIRESLRLVLNGSHGFRCAGAYGEAFSAVRGISARPPRVVLMDIKLPGPSGIECIEMLAALSPRVCVIMLTMFEDDDLVFRALAAGAVGYLLKRASPAEILEAVRDACNGGSPMTNYIARKVVASFRQPRPAPSAEAGLSPREEQLLDLLAKGYRYKELADLMGISLHTVRSHIRRVYEKLEAHSRTEAVRKFRGG